MKTVSEILRDCAFALPASESGANRAALGGTTAPWTSPFICDILEWKFFAEEDTFTAKQYLHSLGMGTGTAEFDFRDRHGEATLETQYQRATWLFFAADLWDEGFRP